MNTSFRTNTILFLLTVIIAVFIYSCGDDEVTNTPPVTYDQQSINGKVTFAETNFVLTGGSYLISAYPETGWPPVGPPSSYDTLSIVPGQASYNYKLVGLNDGKYVVSVGFRRVTGGQSPIMGIYGCDTLHSITCLLSPTLKAEILNSAGVGNIDFLSWADTTKKIY